MDGFKLIMHNRNLYKNRNVQRCIMPTFFPVRKQFANCFMRRRYKMCSPYRGPADPILTCADFSGSFMLSPNARKQSGVSIFHKSRRNRETRQLFNRPVHGGDVIAHLAPVVAPFRINFFFRKQRLINFRPRTLNP